MLFNSFDFGIFFLIVYSVYWVIGSKNTEKQNFFLLVSSYFFYGCWDWRFLSLIFLSTIVDYFIGLRLWETDSKQKRKILLSISILVNIGILGFFKYFNFFLDNFQSLFSVFGFGIDTKSLDIILPVGISFYTFQTLSYTIDIYRKRIKPTKNLLQFSAFVGFFPQLVAGPIERAANLLPQFNKTRQFDYSLSVDGLRQILWGLFKKVIIADNCAIFVNEIFSNYQSYSGLTLILGAVFFAFQIYGDFSGYSDIAIGTAKLLGFNLMTNFKCPYFSRDIAEFWRRWHISLSSWFRDYVYIPLGGSKRGKINSLRNIFIIFLVSGFWHGANWTFIIWGLLNAIYFIPLFLTQKNRVNIDVVAKGKVFPSLREFSFMSITFLLTTMSWIFFRAEDLNHAIDYYKQIGMKFSENIGQPLLFLNNSLSFFIPFLILNEWMRREKLHGLQISSKKTILNWTYYIIIILFIVLFAPQNSQEFIYFQF